MCSGKAGVGAKMRCMGVNLPGLCELSSISSEADWKAAAALPAMASFFLALRNALEEIEEEVLVPEPEPSSEDDMPCCPRYHTDPDDH